MNYKPKSIVEKIGFGKYSPLSLLEIYTGTKIFPKIYTDSFIPFIKQTIINKRDVINSVYGEEYPIENPLSMYNNYIYYSYETDESRFEDYTFDTLKEQFDKIFTIEIPISAIAYQQPNLIDLEQISSHSIINNERYMINEGCPEYVNWLLLEHNSFFIQPAHLFQLEKRDINYHYGNELIKIVNGIASFKPKFSTYRRKFSEIIIAANEEKFNMWLDNLPSSNSAWPEDTFDSLYNKYGNPSDGYGDSLDDDFIDDALDGEPDAYWNID